MSGLGVFKVTLRDGSGHVIVRARCMSCARSVAAESAGREGTLVWRDPSSSSVELLRDYKDGTSRPGLISRSI